MNMIGIIGAMEEEVELLKEKMTDTVIVEKAGMKFVKGNLKGQTAVVQPPLNFTDFTTSPSISNSIEREHTPFVLYTAILKSSFVCFFSVNYSMAEKKRKDKETTGN